MNLKKRLSILIPVLLIFIITGLGLISKVSAETDQNVSSVTVPSPGSELWRDANSETSGRTQSQAIDAGTLIRADGEAWRQFRMEQLIPYSGIAILAVLGAITSFRLIRGEIKIQSGRSGKTITRFTKAQRYAHWVTAVLFILLAITGMVLMFGRSTLLPWMGSEAFSTVAGISKTLHDYSGPLFALSLLWMLVLFIKGNFPKLVDLQWFAKGGGIMGMGHASAGRYNGGEKVWFWLVAIGGILIVISGMVLNFPIFGQTRETMTLYHMLHSISAAVLIFTALGHFYMGSFAMEGAYESMVTGEVDENWAREHHDLWYEEVTGKPANIEHGEEHASTMKQEVQAS